MTFKTHTDTRMAVGTSLQGYMDIGYSDLVSKLGEPGESDGFKVDAEWVLQFEACGTIATIYNYKSGRNYLGPTAPETKDIRLWHIGGRSREALDLVGELFGDVGRVGLVPLSALRT